MGDVRKRMQAVLWGVACAALLLTAHAADSGMERRITTAQPTLEILLPTIPPATQMPEGEKERKKLDLNTVDSWMLTAIPGVGETIAARIIAYREENGGFLDVQELMRIQGIGEKLYSVLEEYVMVLAP